HEIAAPNTCARVSGPQQLAVQSAPIFARSSSLFRLWPGEFSAMIEPLLKSQLDPVAQRQRRWRLQWQLALCWGLAAAPGFVFIVSQRLAHAPFPALMPL